MPTSPSGVAGSQVAQHPNIFPELLRTLFEIVLFEECSNQWSLSRPMLSLVLINGNMYNDMKVGTAMPTNCSCVFPFNDLAIVYIHITYSLSI